ncbi:MAG: hypothetical protein BWY77_00865 [bacterium ADurb.Bin431]|nr:MAG: hypothetical protein BWY77_00865 [bacterium ADurb.Bin431]
MKCELPPLSFLHVEHVDGAVAVGAAAAETVDVSFPLVLQGLMPGHGRNLEPGGVIRLELHPFLGAKVIFPDLIRPVNFGLFILCNVSAPSIMVAIEELFLAKAADVDGDMVFTLIKIAGAEFKEILRRHFLLRIPLSRHVEEEGGPQTGSEQADISSFHTHPSPFLESLSIRREPWAAVIPRAD